jgi:hypothetical protein
MLGKSPDIRRLQNRMDCLTAIGALGAVDFPGYFPIEIMDRKINTPDREIRSLEKAAECPVGLFALLRELLNSLDVGFKFHISESRTIEFSGALQRVRWNEGLGILLPKKRIGVERKNRCQATVIRYSSARLSIMVTSNPLIAKYRVSVA